MITGTRGKFAIIGIGCRMPPNANSLAAFWRFLLRGGNAMKPIKDARWDWRQFFDEDPKRPGKSYAPKAAFLDADIEQFDPLVFGITPREAACLDPQQRLLLESAWEAFEDAGLPIARMAGTATGVFIGGFCLDHLLLQMRPANRHLLNAHSPGGATMTVLSNRISHVFNLKGPSLTLDTACSSSLVAIHYACQSLQSGESEMALAGGVNVMGLPDNPIMMSKGHFLSNHGECHPFDESAAGYARGEGAGVFLIKPLEKALADGNPIHAVIRGSGVNQDGRTDGLSLPSSAAQEALIREVYKRAGVAPAEVDYVEAHGTGTQAGDPAEARALDVNFSEGRDPARKLWIGSVKSNIGHLEAAAGAAGMLKAIGVLTTRKIPKTLHFKTPNPKIPFADYCLDVPVETAALPPESEKPTLYVGVNSFGYGGTNAHILLESAPAPAPPAAADEPGRPRLIPFSARGDEAMRDLAGKFAFQLGQGLPGSLADLAYTTAFRRNHLEHRCAVIASSLEDLREPLIAVSTGQPHPAAVVSTLPADATPALAFVYTGMGPQWWGMGQELIRTEPIVAAAIDEIDAIFKSLSGWSIKDAMMADEASSRMARTEVAQPANFAIQVALTRLWESWGIRPAAVVGHSVGEVVAAYVAGVYTLAEAVGVSYHRSRLQQTAAGLGAMLAVGLPEDEALALIADLPGVSIGAINSFDSVTLSGDKAQLEQAAAELTRREIFNKFLRVEVAYHSPQMDPLRDELLAALANLAPKEAAIPLYSTACGKIVPAAEWSAAYWWQNVRQPVRFASAIQAMLADGFPTMIEVGPHPVLGNSIKECAAHLERKVTIFPSLRRGEPERPRLLLSLADLYCAGCQPDWAALAPAAGRFIPGPLYPWKRQKHWLESDTSKMDSVGLPGPVYLNRRVPSPNPCWEVEINRNYFPFLHDHGVQDQTVFAGMAYIEAAVSLNHQVNQSQAVVLENVSFDKVLIVDDSKLQYLVTEFNEADGRFSISSRVEGDADSQQRHCRGRMFPQTEPKAAVLDVETLRLECPEQVTLDAFYKRLDRRGLRYGSLFRPTQEVFVGDRCFFIRMDAGDASGMAEHLLHPTLMDAALQPVLYCAEGDRLFVPFSIEQFEYYSKPKAGECWAFGRVVLQSETLIVADVWLMDTTGAVHAHAHRISCQLIETDFEQSRADLFYALEWAPAPLEASPGIDGSGVIIFADSEDSDVELARSLAGQLPGALLLARGSNGRHGLEREAWIETLSSDANKHRNRFIVCWGTGKFAAGDLKAISRTSEKLIGLFQAIEMTRTGEVDVTLITRAAKCVMQGDEVRCSPALPVSAIGLVAQNESDILSVRSIDLPSGDNTEFAERIILEIASGVKGETAIRNGHRFESILKSTQPKEKTETLATLSVETPIELRLGTKGKLESLRFEPAERIAPGSGEIEVRVHCAALNYKDLLKIYGRIHPVALERTFYGSEIGMECAGVVLRSGPNTRFEPGDRVVTPLRRGFRTYATVPDTFAVKIPDSLGMEAAGIPAVYLAAYRGLVDIASLQPGERVLIHHGTGGLGLAAIDIARWIGADIFATAGSGEKRQYLRDLGIEHVFSSRNLDFAQRIREATGCEGIDVVISAQTGQAMHVSLNLLRTGGRYIEVGKKDIAEDSGLPMAAFNRNLIFASVDVDQLMNERPALIRQTLDKIFGLFANEDFRLGPSQSFSARDSHEAFRLMARSKQIGKLLVDLSVGEVSVLEKPALGPTIRRDGCYIVTGGTSGFGLLTAQWLARRGAGKVIVASRSGTNAPGIARAVEEIASHGVQVEALSVDVADEHAVAELLARAGAEPFALRGIVHAAMVLDDAMLSDVTAESFKTVFTPKVVGALNLAKAAQGKFDLDFLVFYSSVSSIVGNRGQTSYVAANSVLDGLAHDLRNRGIPALSINWGALAEVGVVARDARLGTALAAGGITGLSNKEALDALEQAIRSQMAQVGVFKINWEQWHEANPKLANDPRFRNYRAQSSEGGANGAASAIRAALAECSKEQRLGALENQLQEVLGGILKMPASTISTNRKLNEMGVDSLLVLELGLGIRERLGVSFSAMEFLKGPTLQQLASMSAGKLWAN